jgi:4-amino-4-deoxy-L-arabinose transferase-like glycosyltransferase
LRGQPRVLLVTGGILALHAIAMFLVLPLLTHSMSELYGIGFADDYDKLAWNLSQGFGYRFFPETAPTLTREPGYPLFLASLFYFFGYSLEAARVANLLLTGITALLLYRLVRKLCAAPTVALIAAVLFLIHPGVFVAELRGGVESLFILLIVCLTTLLQRATESGRTRDYVISGLILGLTTLVRSTALLFPFFMVVFFFLWRSARPPWLKLGGQLLLLFAATVLVVSPWMIRNNIVAGVPLPTASVQPIALHAGQYICSHRTFATQFHDLDQDASRFRRDFAKEQGLRFKGGYYQYFYATQDELAFSRLLSAHVIGNYKADPLLLIECPLENVFNFWFTGKTWTATAMNAAIQLPYLVLAIWGICISLRTGEGRRTGIFMLFILYLMGIHLPVLAQARYSVPLVPFLSLFAALPLGLLLARRAEAGPRPVPA